MAGNTRIRITGALLRGIGTIIMAVGSLGGIYVLSRENVSAGTNFIEVVKNRLVFLIVVGIIAGFGAWMQHHGRKINAQLHALRSEDIPSLQGHVLYLRSFDADYQTKHNIYMGGRAEIERVTEEDLLALALGSQGNTVVAIGRPDEKLPETGARRLYVPDEAWQPTVQRLMATARLVVLRMGLSSGLLWEFEQAVSQLPPHRLLLLIPADQHTYENFAAQVSRLLPILPTFAELPATAGSAKFSVYGAYTFKPDWTSYLIRFRLNHPVNPTAKTPARRLAKDLAPVLTACNQASPERAAPQSQDGNLQE
ncbi:hypothetical protein AB0C21_42750 [Spirillospora sp. NPDC049024]